MTEAIVVALLTGGVFGFAEFLIKRKDKKKDKTEEINKRLEKAELGLARMQLMFLIKMFPESTQQIMLCAEHYFKDLNGNWYMTSIFNSWLVQNKVAKPEWFDETK